MAKKSKSSLYEVLGVEPSASAEEIRAAWRSRTDETGPGSAEFASINAAAEALLDPVRRAAYDATLKPVEPKVEARAVDEGPVSIKALIALAVLTAVTIAAVVAATLVSLTNSDANDVADAKTAVLTQVQNALPVILSYDYQHMSESQQNADRFFTPSYRSQYDRAFALGSDGQGGGPGVAEKLQIAVTSQVKDVAVLSASSSRAVVLAFVDLTTNRAGQFYKLGQASVAVTLKKVGSQWLIDDVKSK